MKSELMDSWILNNLYDSCGYTSSQTLRVLQASKFDISLLSFLILLPSVEASPAQSHYCEATWFIMAGSNQLTSLWISFLLRWWRTRAPWQKAQRVCLPSIVTSSTSKPLRDLDTFHYINPWTCFFNFVFRDRIHLRVSCFHKFKTRPFGNCFQQQRPWLPHLAATLVLPHLLPKFLSKNGSFIDVLGLGGSCEMMWTAHLAGCVPCWNSYGRIHSIGTGKVVEEVATKASFAFA